MIAPRLARLEELEGAAGAVRDGEQNVLAGEIEGAKSLDEPLGPVM